MATRSINWVIQHLRKAALLREGAELTDGQLLEGFVRRREAAALEVLVQRHAPMVWGVCRRIAQNHHDAEDAFQATFLVLVRKAAAIMPRRMVANWHYGVARQTALKARATRAKRQARERQVTRMPESEAVERHDLWPALQSLLDEELSRLPDKYRVAIVLCDLEGKTRKEAAGQLGVPDGTLAARLARARTMLAKRLARHGLAVSGEMLAPVLPQKAASAATPASVITSTIKAVTSVAAGQTAATGLVSAKVVALTEGVLQTMLLTKLKVTTAVLLVLGIAFCGIASLTHTATAQQGQAVQQLAEDAKVQAPPKDDVSARTPPDLKEGVRVVFTTHSNEKFGENVWNDSKAPVVVRVKGNWVLLKGIEPARILGGDGKFDCWVNFDTVDWYVVIPGITK
jgi:RNA polymerase sigma factor (sigma-70 family)